MGAFKVICFEFEDRVVITNSNFNWGIVCYLVYGIGMIIFAGAILLFIEKEKEKIAKAEQNVTVREWEKIMRKKLMVMFMAVCMTVSLVACGNSENSDKKEKSLEKVVENEANDETESSEDSNIKVEEKDETQEQSKSDEQKNVNQEFTVEAEYANLPESQGFEFESNGDGTCTLKNVGTCSDTDIVIPEKSPSGDTVTKIAEYAFNNAEDINSIVFAGKTMKLDKKAFQSCECKKIVITGCDLKIGENAFSYCGDVSEVYISNSKLEVEGYAFYDTGKKMNVTLKKCTGELDDKGFQACGIESLDISECSFELGENAFSYCEDLATVKMENCTLKVGSYAFYDSGDDMAVSFTDCNLDLDDKSFQACGIITLAISGSETIIGENAFSYCKDLTDVVGGANKTEIETYAFYDCTALTNVSIAADSEEDDIELIINDKAFQSCAVQNVVIGRGKVKLGDNAFSYCENLSSVEFKGSSLKVGKYAFYECPAELSISYNGSNYNKESIEEIK